MSNPIYLTIDKITDGNKLTLSLDGSLNASTAPDLEKTLSESLDGVNDLVFDFTGLKFISSTGLRILLSTHKKMSSQGTMKIVGAGEAVMEIFCLTGLDSIFTIE